MLAVSLLITILAQLVASVLSLRGSNLRWAVTTLIRQVHPDLEQHAEAIASDVLTHPLISDSTMSRFAQTPVIGWIFRRWSLANAVRLEELVGALDVLSPPAPAPGAGAGGAGAGGAGAGAQGRWRPLGRFVSWLQRVWWILVSPAPTPAEIRARQDAMAQIAQTARAKMGPQVDAVARQTLELMRGITAAAPAGAGGGAVGPVNIDHLLEKIPGAADTVFGRDIKSWFNSMMDRATQRFTAHMRVVTIAISIVVAFVLHLDSFQLFTDLSASPDVRASLVAQADSMQKLAGSVLTTAPPQAAASNASSASPAPGSTAPSQSSALAIVHVPAVYTAGLRELKKSKDASKEDAAKADALLLKPVDALPPDQLFSNRTAAVDWLKQHVTGDAGERLAKEYQTTVDRLLTPSETDQLLDKATEVQSVLNQTRFRLIPDPYPMWWQWHVWTLFDCPIRVPVPFWQWRARTFFGILFSAGLLGLGAPFWFSALKTMTALRPVLASKQDKETKAATA